MSRPHPAAIVSGPSLVTGVAVGVVSAVAGLQIWAAACAGVAAVVVTMAWLWRRAPKSALKAMSAVKVATGTEPRLENLVTGLCVTHGMAEPALHIVETNDVNAAGLGLRRRSSHLVFTRGALVHLDRLELEAVVARELCEVRRGLKAVTVLAGVARLPGTRSIASRLAARLVDQRTVSATDLEAVRLTCYPPALMGVLKKSSRMRIPGASPAVDHLWVVPPKRARVGRRRTLQVSQRIAILAEV